MERDPLEIYSSELRMEQALIGAVLYGGYWMDVQDIRRAIEAADALLDPEDFWYSAHQAVWTCIHEQLVAGEPVNPLFVYDRAVKIGKGSQVLDSAYLSECADYHFLYGEIVPLAREIRRQSLRRQIGAANDDGDIELAGQLVREVESLSALGNEDVTDMAEVLSTYWDEMDVSAGRPVKTGFGRLDRMTQGFLPGQLIVIGARTGVGKTALAVTLAYNVAVQQDRPVGYVSLEMGEHEIAQRLLAIKTGLSTQEVRTLSGPEGHRTAIGEAMGYLSAKPLYVTFSGSTINEVRNRARSMRDAKGIDLLIVDYLQLMSTSRRSENRVQEVSEISRSLKLLARELEIPVVALAQLNRNADSHEKPRLTDLRDSGAIEQDSDIVLLLHRDEDHMPAATDRVMCMVAKQRNGAVGPIPMQMVRKTTRFVEEEV